jgi:hypothetical protein
MNRIFHFLTIAALLLFGILAASAEEGDDTLGFFLSKADLVVSGTINSNSIVVVTTDPGMPDYLFEFQVEDVLKGEAGLQGKLIRVCIRQFEGSRDWKGHPLLKDGAQCILFLRSVKLPSPPVWREADPWFSVQPANRSMSQSLKRMAGGK